MRSSQRYLLPTNEESIPILHSNSDDPYLPTLVVDLVENTESILRAEPQLPFGLKGGRWPNGLSIPGFDIWFMGQLFLGLLANQRVIFCVDGTEVFLHHTRV